jgi:hypothetical protein
MHSQFHRLITAFARFKADKIAGPLPVNRDRQGLGFDNRTDPAVKAHRAIYVRTKSSHRQDPSSTSQDHRGKDHAHYHSAPQMHQKRGSVKLNHFWVIWCALKLVIMISGIL